MNKNLAKNKDPQIAAAKIAATPLEIGLSIPKYLKLHLPTFLDKIAPYL
jgi:hypothetical protein